jgi:hypothetical protein
MPMSAPRTVNSSQKIFFSMRSRNFTTD